MAIRVLSFDKDGCFFNEKFYDAKPQYDVIHHNKALLDLLIEENKQYTQVYLFEGSDRQSHEMETIHAKKATNTYVYAYRATQEIAKYLHAVLDSIVMADPLGDLPAGTSFARSRIAVKQGRQLAHAKCKNDESKVIPLYLQIQRIANIKPGEEIIFDFFDDQDHLLTKLNDFYTTHPQLIPTNVTLRLHHYEGSACRNIASIEGIGIIDANYYQTVKDMVNQCQPLELSSQIDGSKDLKPDELRNRFEQDEPIEVRCIPIDDESLAKQKFNEALEMVRLKAEYLRGMAQLNYTLNPNENLSDHQYVVDENQSKEYNDYIKASQEAYRFYEALADASEKYFRGSIHKDHFSQIASEAMEWVLPQLKSHRGDKELYLNVVLAIAGLGIIYLGACGINYLINDQFFFKFNTDSSSKVIEVNKAVIGLPTMGIVPAA